MDTDQVQKFVLKSGLNLTQYQAKNSTASRYNVLNMGLIAASKNITNNKATGTDGLSSEIWKLMQNEPTDKIPPNWATSIVVPVIKKGGLKDPNNYRNSKIEQDLQEKIFLAINSLTENVNILIWEQNKKASNKLKLCTPKTQTIPLLETDFFGSPIIEEKRKEIIYECSKLLGMKYTTPLLNEIALYGIQMALANITSPIDDYGSDDLEFAHLMQKLLYDAASNITQARIKNLHKSMELPGRNAYVKHPQRRIPLKPPSKSQSIQQVISSRKMHKFLNKREKQKLSVEPRGLFPVEGQLATF
ncbi:hypothetical protein BB561_000478 [Smittium simulii]|uniref:Uncharacterized protein n=1 Tax=Smittium simulii TaxID=133385 RepID=A0A2T9YYX3_9FUNG|nr:hypothetical protein BB561_000478 [Smittium simulii]